MCDTGSPGFRLGRATYSRRRAVSPARVEGEKRKEKRKERVGKGREEPERRIQERDNYYSV